MGIILIEFKEICFLTYSIIIMFCIHLQSHDSYVIIVLLF